MIAGTPGCLVDNSIIQFVILIYVIERTFELYVYQVNVLLFDPLKVGRENYKIKSATRMVILLVMNMVEYTFWFSSMYSALCFFSGTYCPDGFIFFMDSFSVFTNLSGPSDISFNGFQFLAFVETVIGMFMNLICLARFVGLLPAVATHDDN